jgi:hypothetical protein
MPREATTTTQPSRPRTGRRASDEVVGATGLLQVQPMAIAVSQAFQAASLLNKASNTIWREQHARLRRSGDDTLKGTKHQWLRSYADPGGHEMRDFHRLQRQDLRTAKAWTLKENLRRIWSYRSVSGARRCTNDCAGAGAISGIRPMITTAEIVKRHPRGIAGSVTHPDHQCGDGGGPCSISEPQAQRPNLPIIVIPTSERSVNRGEQEFRQIVCKKRQTNLLNS